MTQRRRPARVPAPLPPDSAEREYFRHLRRYIGLYAQLVEAGLKETLPLLRETAQQELPESLRKDSQERMDANIEKMIASLFARIGKQLDAAFHDAVLQSWAKGMVGHVNRHAKKSTEKAARAVDVEIEPLMRDGELTPYFQNVVEENVGLIRSIPQKYLPAFKNQLVQAITNDAPQDLIRKMIQANFAKTYANARLIARDQTNKLNGALNQYRQQQIGGKRYRWRGRDDGRERPDHLKLNDKIFSWDKPPVVDKRTGRRAHPGRDIQCRCTAEMVIEDVLA